VIDIGNTLVKAAVFEHSRPTGLWTGSEVSEGPIRELLAGRRPRAAIVSTVREQAAGGDHGQQEELPPGLEFLQDYNIPAIVADPRLPTPLKMHYQTPETLGTDRLAAALGATLFFPGQNVLVINAGSCLTLDFVSGEAEYMGGSISPGLNMRLKALNQFTSRLPLVEIPQGEIPLWGQTTVSSVQSGVALGMVAEIDGLIETWRKKISFFNVILSGGDVFFFDKKLKNRIFAVENIVLHGLNLMLGYNV